LTLIKKADPFEYDRADSDAWLDFMNAIHIDATDPAYGAVGGDTGNQATAINAAISALPLRGGIVYLPPNTYRCTSAIVFPTDRPCRLVGAGRGSTIIHVPSGTTATPGVIHLRGTELRSSVEHLSILFDQPDTTVRASMTAYVPAIYAQGIARFRVQHVQIALAWDGIDMRGNCTAEINDLEMSHFNSGIQIDGSLDSIRIAHLHVWPFSCTANQTVAMGDEANIGLKVGRADGLHLSNSLFLCGTAISTFPSIVTTGNCLFHITNCQFDTWSGIVFGAGNIRIGECLFTTLTAFGYQALRVTAPVAGGSLLLSNCFFLTDAGTLVDVEILGQVGAGYLHVNLNNCMFLTGSGNASSITADGTLGGLLQLVVANGHFSRTLNGVYTAPTIGLAGGVRAIIVNNMATDKGTGSGDFVTAVNANASVEGNTIPGWGLNFSGATQEVGGNNVGAVITGGQREMTTVAGFMQASGLEVLSASTPPFALRRYTGSLDGAGTRIFAHGITNAQQVGLLVQAWQKVGATTMSPLAIVAVDGTNINISGGAAGASYRVIFVYTSLPDVW
jgi:hypothetical protein